ncbi:hypothetical protein ACWFNE_08965 [Cellulomonas sp. NPDC055163]
MAAAVVGGAVLTSATSLVAARGPDDVPAAPPEGGPWVIGIRHPRGDLSACGDDAVAESLMTADVPPSSATITLEPWASAADARRVLDCLDRSLTGGEVTVTTRPR